MPVLSVSFENEFDFFTEFVNKILSYQQIFYSCLFKSLNS